MSNMDLLYPSIVKFRWPPDQVIDLIYLYGVQVIERGLTTTAYEAILFNNVNKLKEEYSLRVCFTNDTPDLYMLIQVVDFKFKSDTCFEFTIPDYYDPELYDFFLENE